MIDIGKPPSRCQSPSTVVELNYNQLNANDIKTRPVKGIVYSDRHEAEVQCSRKWRLHKARPTKILSHCKRYVLRASGKPLYHSHTGAHRLIEHGSLVHLMRRGSNARHRTFIVVDLIITQLVLVITVGREVVSSSRPRIITAKSGGDPG